MKGEHELAQASGHGLLRDERLRIALRQCAELFGVRVRVGEHGGPVTFDSGLTASESDKTFKALPERVERWLAEGVEDADVVVTEGARPWTLRCVSIADLDGRLILGPWVETAAGMSSSDESDGGRRRLVVDHIMSLFAMAGLQQPESGADNRASSPPSALAVGGLERMLLSVISHELRTPLTSIIGYSDMLLEGISGELNADQNESLMVIRRQGEQLLSMISNLLDISRIDRGGMPIFRAETDVIRVVQDVVDMVRPQAMKAGVEVRVVADEVPSVFGDSDSLRQVFRNLVDNAIKFSESGGVVQLQVRLLRSDLERELNHDLKAPMGRLVAVSVTDAGPGIPERERDRIFDAFYQVDRSHSRQHAGAGLGLSIVKHLVDAHDGTIGVRAADPRGTVFEVRLPGFTGVETLRPPRTTFGSGE